MPRRLPGQLLPVVLAAALLVPGMWIQEHAWSGASVRVRLPGHTAAAPTDPLLALGALEYSALLGQTARPGDVEAVGRAPELAGVLSDLRAWMPLEGDVWWGGHGWGHPMATPGSLFFQRPVVVGAEPPAEELGARFVSVESEHPHDRLVVGWDRWRPWMDGDTLQQALRMVDDHSQLCLRALEAYLADSGVPSADRLVLLQRRAWVRHFLGLPHKLLYRFDRALEAADFGGFEERSTASGLLPLAQAHGRWEAPLLDLERKRILGEELRATWSLLGLVWLACAVAHALSRRRERATSLAAPDSPEGSAGLRTSSPLPIVWILAVPLLTYWILVQPKPYPNHTASITSPDQWIQLGEGTGSLRLLTSSGPWGFPLAVVVVLLAAIAVARRGERPEQLRWRWHVLMALACAGAAQIASAWIVPAAPRVSLAAQPWIAGGVLMTVTVLVACGWGRPGTARREGILRGWLVVVGAASLCLGAARAGLLPRVAATLGEQSMAIVRLTAAGLAVLGFHRLITRRLGRGRLDPVRVGVLLAPCYLLMIVLDEVVPATGEFTAIVTSAIPQGLALATVCMTASAFAEDRRRTEADLPSSQELARITGLCARALLALGLAQLVLGLLTSNAARLLLHDLSPILDHALGAR